MLMRTRVVSVVSVLVSSAAGASAGSPFAAPSRGPSCGCSDGNGRVPYGGVPDGYAAPPRPWGPGDGRSVSRLKAGSPGSLRHPSRPFRGRPGGAHHHTGHRVGAACPPDGDRPDQRGLCDVGRQNGRRSLRNGRNVAPMVPQVIHQREDGVAQAWPTSRPPSLRPTGRRTG
ncbi:hypothetical protein GTY85_18590 [Streptomyces sp. SID8377]|nr:hypothetical protein [Streptomyces sp. SID8377]